MSIAAIMMRAHLIEASQLYSSGLPPAYLARRPAAKNRAQFTHSLREVQARDFGRRFLP